MMTLSACKVWILFLKSPWIRSVCVYIYIIELIDFDLYNNYIGFWYLGVFFPFEKELDININVDYEMQMHVATAFLSQWMLISIIMHIENSAFILNNLCNVFLMFPLKQQLDKKNLTPRKNGSC